MANQIKTDFLLEAERRFGKLERLGNSLSMFQVKGSEVRVYIRYSRMHQGNRTWYGLREQDLQDLEGFPSILCFLCDDQDEPLLIPYSEYEDVFQSIEPASDGQYKAQVLFDSDGTEFYIARVGRFNVEDHIGWHALENLFQASTLDSIPELTHSQVQTLLGSIGRAKEYDIWIPNNDRSKLDWKIAPEFPCREILSFGVDAIADILQGVDVLWVNKGSNNVQALFEVEHSTPIYSGLLRFNDIHLVTQKSTMRYSIVANSTRRSLFARQLIRPTFQTSGIGNLCTFLEYSNVYNWHARIYRKG